MEAKAKLQKEKGEAFAATFAKEEGVKPIPMGGYIKIEKAGEGPNPGPDDTVKVNYRGTLIDGTEFDSSYKRHEPAEFPLRNVIPCWTNGVAMMKAGGKAKLVCPSDVAYGDQGHPPVIPGGSTLVFEIELLDIVKPEAPKEAAPVKPEGKKK
jgi:FKBP-type peptidyl-prolyl cis-trans isomerase FkpA